MKSRLRNHHIAQDVNKAYFSIQTSAFKLLDLEQFVLITTQETWLKKKRKSL